MLSDAIFIKAIISTIIISGFTALLPLSLTRLTPRRFPIIPAAPPAIPRQITTLPFTRNTINAEILVASSIALESPTDSRRVQPANLDINKIMNVPVPGP